MFRDSFDTIVQVRVGPQLILFDLHKTLLCNAAGYFKTALQGNLLEGKEQVIEFSKDDPKAFARFQLWLYTENLLEKEESRTAIPWKRLIDIYVFSYIHGVPDLQNVVIDAFIDKHAASRTIPISTLSYLYDKTTETSLRRVVIDLTAYSADLDDCLQESRRHTIPKDFLIELAFAQGALRKSKKRTIKDFGAARSDYYVKTTLKSSS